MFSILAKIIFTMIAALLLLSGNKIAVGFVWFSYLCVLMIRMPWEINGVEFPSSSHKSLLNPPKRRKSTSEKILDALLLMTIIISSVYALGHMNEQ